MDIIAEVRSDEPKRPLVKLLSIPLGLDIWEVNADRLVLRAPEATTDRLAQMGYRVRQIIDVQSHLSTFATAQSLVGYHSAESLGDDMRALAERRPEVAELQEIGRSLEGRPIWALRIGERRGNGRKLLFLGCHHAREWISVEVPFLLARELVEKADEAPISGWLSAGEIWIVPMVNPDGHEFSRTQNRLWRKNRRPNPDGSFGVDPNRNYGYMWGILDIPTSSHVPSDETYVGPRAFSEPETQAVRDLIATQKFSGLITYHSFTQLVLYPWGYTAEEIADSTDREIMIELAQGMAERIRQIHGMEYIPQQSSKLYPTAGDTTDWTYGIYGIPSFTIELRPKTVEEGGFILPASQIQPTFEENRSAAFYFIERLLPVPAHG
jgi:carboxypeptidase T